MSGRAAILPSPVLDEDVRAGSNMGEGMRAIAAGYSATEVFKGVMNSPKQAAKTADSANENATSEAA